MKTTNSRNRLIFFMLLAGAFLLFAAKSFFILDPDFGWHLRMGEHIARRGIPKTDPFSYSMPDYPFVDHEYLTNIILARAYPVLGLQGLALVFAGAAILIFIPYFSKRETLPFLALPAVAMAAFVGVRPQVVSWIFVWVFFTLLRRGSASLKTLLFLVFLQGVWVNLHGGFFLGLVLSGLYALMEAVRSKRLGLPLAGYLLASFLVTFLNPYGYRVWWEVFMQLSDQSLRWSVQEWLPAFAMFDASFWFYLGISAGFFIKYYRSASPYERVVYVLFLAAGLASMRNIPLWIIVSFPVLCKTAASLQEDIPARKDAQARYALFLKAAAIGVMAVAVFQMMVDVASFGPFTERGGYPGQAIGYIREHRLPGNILASYDWGGYLIWKMPEKKVFVDGRMPSWRWNQSNPGLSGYAYRDYRDIVGRRPGYEKLLAKYKISYLLMRAQTKDALWFGAKRPTAEPYPHMKVLYRDNIAVLYKTGY